MNVNNQPYQTVWIEEDFLQNPLIHLIDQNLLPFEFKTITTANYQEACQAIKNMNVRGAVALGVYGGYALSQAFVRSYFQNQISPNNLGMIKRELAHARPTAKDLSYVVNKIYSKIVDLPSPAIAAIDEAKKEAQSSLDSCKKIGEYGNTLIKDNFNIMTHCNAGWLGCVDYGTALAPIYFANREHKKIFVYADETGPRGQGARLTAWELSHENVPHRIVPDNAGAYLMSTKKIDLMIVGADRIALNGDTANKIGTFEKAIIAKHFNVPFYIAAPLSTFDINCNTGLDIEIEQRSPDEVLYKTGPNTDGQIQTIHIASPNSSAINPAFDVTPAELITGIITPKGIIKPNRKEIERLFY